MPGSSGWKPTHLQIEPTVSGTDFLTSGGQEGCGTGGAPSQGCLRAVAGQPHAGLGLPSAQPLALGHTWLRSKEGHWAPADSTFARLVSGALTYDFRGLKWITIIDTFATKTLCPPSHSLKSWRLKTHVPKY